MKSTIDKYHMLVVSKYFHEGEDMKKIITVNSKFEDLNLCFNANPTKEMELYCKATEQIIRKEDESFDTDDRIKTYVYMSKIDFESCVNLRARYWNKSIIFKNLWFTRKDFKKYKSRFLRRDGTFVIPKSVS